MATISTTKPNKIRMGARVICWKSNILLLNTSGLSEPPPIIKIKPKAMRAIPINTMI